MSEQSRSRSFFGKHPYRNMFMAFMAIVIAAALMPEQIIGGHLYDFMVAGILLVALVETTRSRRHAVVALAVGVPAVVARLAFSYADDTAVTNSGVLVLSALFFGFLIWNFLRDLMVGDRLTSERIFGALSAYLCIGLLFALVYAHMHYRDPTAFRIPDDLAPMANQVESATMPAFTYFSFVTLTTLGYGDFLPVSEQARSLAWLEAIIGQLFLAVMVGGLVGVYFAEAAQQAARASFGSAPPKDPKAQDDDSP